MTKIRHIVASESQAAVSLMARAFFDDPLTVWIFPDAEARGELNASFEALNVRAAVQRGHAYELTDGSGAALWAPPGVDLHDEAGIEEVVELIRSADPERADEVLGGLLQTIAARPETPHFYLAEIGVVPEAWGRGLGSRLLRDGLERCDRYGHPAYLDATSLLNVALYRRHRFEVTQEIQLSNGPTLWGMWREPRSSCGPE